MLIHEDPVKRRFISLPRYEPLIPDSSVIMEYKSCAYRYFLRYVLGYDELNEPIYLTFGSAYHKYREMLEIYFKREGDSKSQAVLDKCSALAMGDALVLWGKTPNPPPDSDFFWLTKERLISVLTQAHQLWKQEKANGQFIVLGTEQPFNVTLSNGVKTGGLFDQIVKWNGMIWGRDFKTTTKQFKYWQRMIWPNDQFVRYTVAQGLLHGAPIQGQIIDSVHSTRPTQKDSRPTTFERSTLRVAPQSIELWTDEQQYWNAVMQLSRDNDLYPRNEKACGYCKFHRVCQATTEPQQEIILKQNYKVRLWDYTKGEDD